TQTILSSAGLLEEPTGVAIAPDGGVYVMDRAHGLVKVDPATGMQTLITAGNLFRDAYGIAIDATGNIYIADSGFKPTSPGSPVNMAGQILRVDPETGAQTVIAEGTPCLEIPVDG